MLFRVFIRLVFFLFLSGEDFDEIPLGLLQRERERERVFVRAWCVVLFEETGGGGLLTSKETEKGLFQSVFFHQGKQHDLLGEREREREREKEGGRERERQRETERERQI